jgi:hypothetical protein
MADTEAAIPSSGPLSIDQHVALLSKEADAPEADNEQEEQEEANLSPDDEGEVEASGDDTQDSEAATQAADDGAEAPETDTLEADEAQAPEPAKQPTLDPPARWEAEDKALFAKLPRKAQETILKREKLQQAEVTRAQQKSAEAIRAYETRIHHLNDLANRIGEQYVEPGIDRMKQWDEWFASDDAAELARTNPGQFLAEQTRYRAEHRELQQTIAAKQKAEEEAFREFAAEQSRLMAEIIPAFADPVEGPKRKSELAAYLQMQGFEPQRIRGISAQEAAISFKAKTYDEIDRKYADSGGIQALIKDAERYRQSAARISKAPPPKPKVKAGPSAPASSQGHRPSSDEAALQKLMTKASWTAEEHTRVMQLRAKLGKR